MKLHLCEDEGMRNDLKHQHTVGATTGTAHHMEAVDNRHIYQRVMFHKVMLHYVTLRYVMACVGITQQHS